MTVVAVIGGGGFGKVHLEILSRMRDVDILVFDKNNAVLREYELKYGAEPMADTVSAIREAEIVDIVLPHYLHKEVAIRSIRSGKHVVMEKPIATNSADGKEIIREAKEKHVKFMVLENYYFEKPLHAALKLIEDGRIGKPLSMRFTKIKRVHPTEWGCIPELMGGGAFVDDGIHLVDSFLNAGGEYHDIQAMRFNLSTSRMGGEDTTSVTVRFGSGAFGSLIHSWSFDLVPPIPRFEIIGTEGWIAESPATRIMPRKFGNILLNGREIGFEPYNPFEIGISGFIDSVRNETEVPMNPEIALRDLIFVERVYAASPSISRIDRRPEKCV